MITDHFPTDTAWQLTKRVVSPESFKSMISISMSGIANGLEVQSHPKNVINTSTDHVEVIFLANRDAVLLLGLRATRGRAELRDGYIWHEETPQGSKVEHKYTMYFPTAGQYDLKVFIKKQKASGSYGHGLSYTIKASRGYGNKKKFPRSWGTPYPVQMKAPMDMFIGKTTKFKLHCPECQKAVVVNGGQWNYLDSAGNGVW